MEKRFWLDFKFNSQDTQHLIKDRTLAPNPKRQFAPYRINKSTTPFISTSNQQPYKQKVVCSKHTQVFYLESLKQQYRFLKKMVKEAPPPLTNETLQQRLLTGTGIKGGSRGSLTRCAAKIGALNAKLNAPGGSTDEEILAIKNELKREVRLFQIEMHKIMIAIQSADKELQTITLHEQKMEQAVARKHKEVSELRQQAAQEAKTRKCWQEYEALAKLARQRSPRRILQAKMDKMNKDLEATKKKLYETAAESKVREKQFHLLIQVMVDLKRSMGETIELPPPPKDGEGESAANEDVGEKQAAVESKEEDTTESGGEKTMEVEEEGEENVEDLYGDVGL